MKRPVVWIGVCMLLGILLIQFLSPKTCLRMWGAGVLLFFLIGSFLKMKNLYRYLFYSLFCLLGMVISIAYHTAELNVRNQLLSDNEIECIVYEEQASNYLCRIPCASWFSFLVEIPCEQVSKTLYAGDTILVSGIFHEFSKPTNDGAFDSKKWNECKGILGELTPEQLSITHHNKWGRNSISKSRNKIRTVFREYLADGPYGLMVAFFTGDRGDLPSSDRELFQRFGVSHILAISGMHIAVFSGLLGFLLGKQFRKKIANLICFLFLFLFGILCGFGVSVVRVMGSYFLGAVAGFRNRRKDGMTSLCIVMIVLLMRRPVLCTDTGFLLSFGAAFTFLVILPCFHRVKNQDQQGPRIMNCNKHYVFSDALQLQLFLLPVLLVSSYAFSPYTVLVNIVVLPFLPIVLFAGILLLLGSVFLPILSIGCAFLISGFYFGVISLLKIVDRLPFSILVTGKPGMSGIIVFYSVFVILSLRSYYGGRYVLRNGILVMSIVFLVSVHKGCEIYNLSVGQGDCSVILRNHHATVIDCGSAGDNHPGSRILTDFLHFHGISKIDYVILSHNDKDHVSGIIEISDRISIGHMICTEEPEEEHLRQMFKESGTIYRKGDHLFWQGMDFLCLWPEQEETQESLNSNDRSLVFLLSWEDGNALFTGDVSAEVLDELVGTDTFGKLKSIDYFKVPHHGSKYSYSDLAYSYLNPGKCVISVGRNNVYGHPSETVIEGINEQKCDLHRTDRDGQSVYQIPFQ